MVSHRAICPLEKFDTGAESFEEFGRIRLLNVFIDNIPQLVVVLVEKDNSAGRLDVERAGSVENRMLDELDDTGVGNGGFFLGGDGRATMNGCVEEAGLGSHADWAGCICHLEGRRRVTEQVLGLGLIHCVYANSEDDVDICEFR